MSTRRQPTAIIVADSHFHLEPDPAEQERLERFLALLECSRRADHLVLLGDIFDFWFDYPHFRLKGYHDLLEALDLVREAGCQIHFVGGNHDIWAAEYLHRRYGSEADGLPLTLQLGDLRLRCEHGDGLLSHDWLYSSFRALVRNRAGILLAKSLHPEILYSLSSWLSGRSRSATRDEAAEIEAKASVWLAKQRNPDWDVILIGHVHHRFQTETASRKLAALAGWFDRLDYGLVQDGQFQIRDFSDDTLPEF